VQVPKKKAKKRKEQHSTDSLHSKALPAPVGLAPQTSPEAHSPASPGPSLLSKAVQPNKVPARLC